MSDSEKVVCPSCRKLYSVTALGEIRKHGDCPGGAVPTAGEGPPALPTGPVPWAPPVTTSGLYIAKETVFGSNGEKTLTLLDVKDTAQGLSEGHAKLKANPGCKLYEGWDDISPRKAG